MATFKVVEYYPQTTVRLIYRVEAESEDVIREEFQADWGELVDTEIDYGDSAYTESVTEIEEG